MSKLWKYCISTTTWKSPLCTQPCACQTSAQPLCRILHNVFLSWGRGSSENTSQSLITYLVSCGPEWPKLFLVSETLKPKPPSFQDVLHQNVPLQEICFTKGKCSSNGCWCFVQVWFPSTTSRMGTVLGWWLILCARECHGFEISCFVSSWEAENMEGKSICTGKRGSSVFQSVSVCFWRTFK